MKLMSCLRFELDKQNKMFLMPSAELGTFNGEEWYLRGKNLLPWLQTGMAF